MVDEVDKYADREPYYRMARELIEGPAGTMRLIDLYFLEQLSRKVWSHWRSAELDEVKRLYAQHRGGKAAT